MASESTRTAAFLKAWRLKYPDGVAWKINDRVARSRPDAMLLRNATTTYIEFKREGNPLTASQEYELEKIAKTSHRALHVIFLADGDLQVYQKTRDGWYDWSRGRCSTAQFLAFLA